MPAPEWYYFNADADSVVGPFTGEALVVLQRGGAIDAGTLVSNDAGVNWLPLGSVILVQEDHPSRLAGSELPRTPTRPRFGKKGAIAVLTAIAMLIAVGGILWGPGLLGNRRDYRSMAREHLSINDKILFGEASKGERARWKELNDLLKTDPDFAAVYQVEINSMPVPAASSEAFDNSNPFSSQSGSSR